MQVLAGHLSCFQVGMAESEMVIRIRQLSRASPTTVGTPRASSRVSRLPARSSPRYAISLNEVYLYLFHQVGATQRVPEVAVSRFFSGGGFSDFVRRLSHTD